MSTTVPKPLPALPEWGIDPVPDRHRTLNGVDLAVLWGDLGIGLLVLVAGGLLVPALSFPTALGAIVLGSVIGVALLGLVAVAGADHAVPTMVLFRPVLGIRGSWIPSALNSLQLIGWTAVELWAMSHVADLVARRTLDISARGLWLGIAAVVCTALALWGPIGVTRVWMERFGVWVIGAISVAVTLLLVLDADLAGIWSRSGTGGLGFGPALDLVIAMPISWLPLVADYARFTRRPRAAFGGTFWGYLIANVWLYALGALLVLGAGSDPSPAGMAAGILSLAGGSIAGMLFLAGLLVGETDEAFADIYSGAVSLQNIFPRAPRALLTILIAGVAAVLASWLTMEDYESFLFLIGSVFVPLFGVLSAELFIHRRRRLDRDELYEATGRYWFWRGLRVAMLLPWVAGFVVYHWILPTGPSGWIDFVTELLGSPLSTGTDWVSASIPSFALAFFLTLLVRPIEEPS